MPIKTVDIVEVFMAGPRTTEVVYVLFFEKKRTDHVWLALGGAGRGNPLPLAKPASEK